MRQISNAVFCDDFITGLKLDGRLMPNPYYEYPYLHIENFLSKSLCREIAEYTSGACEAEEAKVKSTLLNAVVDPSVDESIRKTMIHTLPAPLLREYERSFRSHQRQIEEFFRIALTTATTLQVLEYTKGSFYIRHSDDSSEVVNSEGQTVGFVQVAPQRKITTVLFATSHALHGSDDFSFSGGELLFNYLFDARGDPLKLYPNAGDMIVFPSNPIYSHEVLMVESGYRLTLVQWHNGIVA